MNIVKQIYVSVNANYAAECHRNAKNLGLCIRPGMQKAEMSKADKRMAVLPTSHLITAKLKIRSHAIITGRTFPIKSLARQWSG